MRARKKRSDIGDVGERAVEKFYETQLERSILERARLARNLGTSDVGALCAAATARGCTAKWNRQELYLQPSSLELAKTASRRHLSRHRAWLNDRVKFDEETLKEIVAMQHFAQVDLDDMLLPPTQRRSEDVFAGHDGNVCEQMLLDAARSDYVIKGQRFVFGEVLQERALSFDRDRAEIELAQQSFGEQLVLAVRRCLGAGSPPHLLRAVTTVLSQSGLANVERACADPQVVVCGGDQTVQYDLTPAQSGDAESLAWDIRMLVRKCGFDQCMIYDAPGMTDDPSPLSCSTKSLVLKSSRLRYCLHSSDSGEERVEVDVVEVVKELRILDQSGLPLKHPALSSKKLRGLRARVVSLLACFSTRICRSCRGFCTVARGVVKRVFGFARFKMSLDSRVVSKL